jgi:hypothetical protein
LADHLVLSAPNPTVAGSPFQVLLIALDAQGQVAKGYTGTVHFSNSDPYPGVLPPDYTFSQGDSGTHRLRGSFQARKNGRIQQPATFHL